MDTIFATIIHTAPKLDINELLEVRKQLSANLATEFVKECDVNYDLIHPVVAKNIDFRKLEDGEKVLRMVNLAKEMKIDYTPTREAAASMQAYCVLKDNPLSEGVSGAGGPVPQNVPSLAVLESYTNSADRMINYNSNSKMIKGIELEN